MKLKFSFVLKAVLFVLVFGALSACDKYRPIYEVPTQSFQGGSGLDTVEKVEQKIAAAASRLGWRVKKISPGVIHSSYQWGRHVATVRIDFDTESYSIRHQSSTNLAEHTGTKDTRYEGQQVIHKRYNKYVRNLQRRIDQALAES